MRIRWVNLGIGLCCALFALNIWATEAVVVISPQQDRYPIHSMDYLIDPSGNLTLNELLVSPLRFIPLSESVPNSGFIHGAYWFRWRLTNQSGLDGFWLLENQYALLDQVTLYQMSADGSLEIQQAGDTLQMSLRAIAHRNPLFRIALVDNQTKTLYLRVQTQGSLSLPLVLWSESAFSAQDHDVQIAFGFYYGMILMMLLYNFLIYLYIKDINYLYFVLYLLAYGLFQLSLNGLAAEYLWPEWPWWGSRTVPLFICVSIACISQFCRSFLQLSLMMPKMDWLLYRLQWLVSLTAVFGLALNYSLAVQLSMLQSVLIGGCLSWAGFSCSRSSFDPARSFMLAWSLFLVGMLVYCLKSIGVFPELFLTEYGIQIGSSLKILLLSFALTQRIRLLNEENLRTQAQTNQLLEQRVQQRTVELEQALTQLSRAYERLEEASARDGLTNLYNRRYFDNQYQQEWRRALRAGEELAVLMVDLDHFKWVNDNFGHLLGDDVLRQTAGVLKAICRRPADLAARYGGEEFVLVLPQTNREGAVVLAEQLRSCIHQLTIEDNKSGYRLSASIGLACTIPQPEQEPEFLLAVADAALYQAKHLGRNRVVAA